MNEDSLEDDRKHESADFLYLFVSLSYLDFRFWLGNFSTEDKIVRSEFFAVKNQLISHCCLPVCDAV